MRLVTDDNGNPINAEDRDFVNLGLGGCDDNSDGLPGFPGEEGRFKILTVRNLFTERFARAWFHNGYFKSLEGVILFYNTRATKPVCTDSRGIPQKFVTESQALKRGRWPLPEVAENIFDCDAGAIARSS
jgi:cytochrome c peroxidase